MYYLYVIFCLIFYFPFNVLSFHWESCGKDTYPIKITDLNVITGKNQTLLISGKGKVAEEITFPLKAKLKLARKLVWGWTEIPCIDNIGSCEYIDICTLSPYIDQDCPEEFVINNLPCKCPIEEGKYTVKDFPVEVRLLPHFLQSGEYKIKLLLQHKKEDALCIILELKI